MKLYDDEFDGVGGSYLVDPNAGKRVRTEEPTRDHPDGNRARDAAETPVDAPAPSSPAPVAQQDTGSEQPAGTSANAGEGIGPAGGAAKSPEDSDLRHADV